MVLCELRLFHTCHYIHVRLSNRRSCNLVHLHMLHSASRVCGSSRGYHPIMRSFLGYRQLCFAYKFRKDSYLLHFSPSSRYDSYDCYYLHALLLLYLRDSWLPVAASHADDHRPLSTFCIDNFASIYLYIAFVILDFPHIIFSLFTNLL